MAWKSLNDIYVPNVGGSIDGNLNVSGNLTINDGSGSGATYDVSSEISELKTDYIVAQGTSGIWTYCKWASGRAECWGSKTISAGAINKTWGNWYYHDHQAIGNYPFSFTAVPAVTMFKDNGCEGVILVGSGGTKTAAPSVYLARPSTYSDADYSVHVAVAGRWK
jgi:hypothetical protein